MVNFQLNKTSSYQFQESEQSLSSLAVDVGKRSCLSTNRGLSLGMTAFPPLDQQPGNSLAFSITAGSQLTLSSDKGQRRPALRRFPVCSRVLKAFLCSQVAPHLSVLLKMHPDLSPHLHTEECNVLINLLKECHKNVRIPKGSGSGSTAGQRQYMTGKAECMSSQ